MVYDASAASMNASFTFLPAALLLPLSPLDDTLHGAATTTMAAVATEGSGVRDSGDGSGAGGGSSGGGGRGGRG